MKGRIIFGVPLALMLLALPILSHDYWLLPEAFFASPGASVRVRLYVGDDFKIEAERPLQKVQTSRFEMFSADGKPQDLVADGQDNQTPVTQVSFKSTGNYLIAMSRKNSFITLQPKDFNKYLSEEGLEHVIAEREKAGESEKPGRECYSRSLKSLVQVGERHDDTYKRTLNQRLEIIPQTNPYQLRRGDTLTVRVFFEGKPLRDAKVFTYNRDAGTIYTQEMRSDADGQATFKIDRPGEWLIRLVNMRRCENCTDADWESFWGAYSFGMK